VALSLKHQTAQQFIARLRTAYRDGNHEAVIKIARFILARIQSGDITDAQCRSAFGLTVTQWNALKTKMKGFITADDAAKAATGE
jgi:hypothetical protein